MDALAEALWHMFDINSLQFNLVFIIDSKKKKRNSCGHGTLILKLNLAQKKEKYQMIFLASTCWKIYFEILHFSQGKEDITKGHFLNQLFLFNVVLCVLYSHWTKILNLLPEGALVTISYKSHWNHIYHPAIQDRVL